VLAVLVALHLAAFWLYSLRETQTHHLQQYLGARELWREGKLDAAAREYRSFLAAYPSATRPFKLRKNYPSEPMGWFSLGRIEGERGDVDAALAAYREAMKRQPGLGRREYRDLLLESGRPAALAEFAGRELAADPASAVAWWDAGAARLALGDPAGAAEAYRSALLYLPDLLERLHVPHPPGALTGEEADLLNLLSVAHLLAGERDAAEANCNAIAHRAPPGAALDRLCRAYLLGLAGDRDGAAWQLSGVQAPGPEHEALVQSLRARLGLPAPPRASTAEDGA
jgi:tetratricopeptide (TPR) repeat protein